MKKMHLCVMIAALGCAEPAVTAPRPAARTIGEQQQQNNSYSIDAADRTVYVTLTQMRSEGGEPIHAFVRSMFESADSADSRRLVIDLRSISGSDTRLLVPLIKGIVARERFVQHGGLVVVIGEDSFSPRQKAATLLQQYASPIFVWQPPGLSPIS